MKLLKQCTLDGVTRRKDKSLKISFITNLEQSSSELMEVDKLLDSSGVLYFKQGEGVSTEEILAINETNLDQPKKRTESQETKIMIWRCWKDLTEEGKYSKSQEVFYKAMHTWFRQQLEDRYLKK
tara:strand:+ start:43 stop:417 length:375 start_codon:yes stop_codon:yes gene_type:complete